MKRTSFSIISLGCPKNTVDSETLSGKLQNLGCVYKANPEEAEIVIVNTCGFIEQSRAESIETIFETLKLKETGSVRKVFIMGCLTQRYGDLLRKEIPEADRIDGVHSIDSIVEAITRKKSCCADEESRVLLTPSYLAYLKIAEGCDNSCAFCSIPLIRGKQQSRSISSLLREAEYLRQKGVKEIILVAQDLTRYGSDLPGKVRLVDLLEDLLQANLFPWVRLMYNHPDFWLPEMNTLFGKYPALVPYIDIPIQHASNRILKLMNRGKDREEIRRVLKTIRNDAPSIALRTSVMVGFPSESEADFNELLDFIEEIRFERLGVFTYSQEEGTASANLPDNIPAKEKERRKEIVMQLQWDISHEFALNQIGKILDVLIEEKKPEGFVGRSVWDAPEIDCSVIVNSEVPVPIGEIAAIAIDEVQELDLIGHVVEKNQDRT
ncbi:MAG: 30S ribosomal protein S12 methylthiotransferase RimO [Candidatus Marinimicrobia bacterium]|nr:30S ribosomal protein S12 methylthiotransferase RimO [Candidatus Neomarinimicrobiota bacterium]